MKTSFFYYAGLILAIMGLIGIISESGPVWSRYFILGLGVALLLTGYLKQRPK